MTGTITAGNAWFNAERFNSSDQRKTVLVTMSSLSTKGDNFSGTAFTTRDNIKGFMTKSPSSMRRRTDGKELGRIPDLEVIR